MDEFINFIVGESMTMDIYFIARLVAINMSLELLAVICAMLNSAKGR